MPVVYDKIAFVVPQGSCFGLLLFIMGIISFSRENLYFFFSLTSFLDHLAKIESEAFEIWLNHCKAVEEEILNLGTSTGEENIDTVDGVKDFIATETVNTFDLILFRIIRLARRFLFQKEPTTMIRRGLALKKRAGRFPSWGPLHAEVNRPIVQFRNSAG